MTASQVVQDRIAAQRWSDYESSYMDFLEAGQRGARFMGPLLRRRVARPNVGPKGLFLTAKSMMPAIIRGY